MSEWQDKGDRGGRKGGEQCRESVEVEVVQEVISGRKWKALHIINMIYVFNFINLSSPDPPRPSHLST